MTAFTIGKILETTPDVPMRELPVIMKALTLSDTITPISEDMTAGEVFKLLSQHEPDVLRKTVAEILRPSSSGSGLSERCKSIIVWALLTFITFAYVGVNTYVAIKTMTTIPWEDMLLPFIGPISIALHERGVTSKENRSSLSAALGGAPILTVMEAVSQRIAGQARPPLPETTESEEPAMRP